MAISGHGTPFSRQRTSSRLTVQVNFFASDVFQSTVTPVDGNPFSKMRQRASNFVPMPTWLFLHYEVNLRCKKSSIRTTILDGWKKSPDRTRCMKKPPQAMVLRFFV